MQSPGALFDFSKIFPENGVGDSWTVEAGQQFFCKIESVLAKRFALLRQKTLNKWVLYANPLTYVCWFTPIILGKHAMILRPWLFCMPSKGSLPVCSVLDLAEPQTSKSTLIKAMPRQIRSRVRKCTLTQELHLN